MKKIKCLTILSSLVLVLSLSGCDMFSNDSSHLEDSSSESDSTSGTGSYPVPEGSTHDPYALVGDFTDSSWNESPSTSSKYYLAADKFYFEINVTIANVSYDASLRVVDYGAWSTVIGYDNLDVTNSTGVLGPYYGPYGYEGSIMVNANSSYLVVIDLTGESPYIRLTQTSGSSSGGSSSGGSSGGSSGDSGDSGGSSGGSGSGGSGESGGSGGDSGYTPHYGGATYDDNMFNQLLTDIYEEPNFTATTYFLYSKSNEYTSSGSTGSVSMYYQNSANVSINATSEYLLITLYDASNYKDLTLYVNNESTCDIYGIKDDDTYRGSQTHIFNISYKETVNGLWQDNVSTMLDFYSHIDDITPTGDYDTSVTYRTQYYDIAESALDDLFKCSIANTDAFTESGGITWKDHLDKDNLESVEYYEDRGGTLSVTYTNRYQVSSGSSYYDEEYYAVTRIAGDSVGTTSISNGYIAQLPGNEVGVNAILNEIKEECNYTATVEYNICRSARYTDTEEDAPAPNTLPLYDYYQTTYYTKDRVLSYFYSSYSDYHNDKPSYIDLYVNSKHYGGETTNLTLLESNVSLDSLSDVSSYINNGIDYEGVEIVYNGLCFTYTLTSAASLALMKALFNSTHANEVLKEDDTDVISRISDNNLLKESICQYYDGSNRMDLAYTTSTHTYQNDEGKYYQENISLYSWVSEVGSTSIPSSFNSYN